MPYACLQDFKENIDAEGLMPLNTSDFHKTICMEMRMTKAMNFLNLCHGGTKSSSFVTPLEHVGPNKFTFPLIDAATISGRDNQDSSINSRAFAAQDGPHSKDSANSFSSNQNYKIYHSNNADLASVDSSDTFMSCQTHPFLSQGDLTVPDDGCNLDMIDAERLYLTSTNTNSSGTLTRGSSLYIGGVNIVDSNLSEKGQVKKSISGDTALHNLGVSPNEITYTGSRVSLNETPNFQNLVPKHRKTRFQQQQQQPENSNVKLKARFNDEKEKMTEKQELAVSTKDKNRKASLLPTKIITTATKQLINQHLFGIQTKGETKDDLTERCVKKAKILISYFSSHHQTDHLRLTKDRNQF